MNPQLQSGDALLVVDVQRDFCAGGALAVPDGDAVVGALNAWIARARDAGVPIVASRDWHPIEHCSFDSQGGPWPAHCVQDADGAAFHGALELPRSAVRVSKGTAFDKDAYSAFDGTGLDGFLKRHGVTRLVVGGLAEDVCVRHTVLDACRNGYDVFVDLAATRAVDPAAKETVESEMRSAGARLFSSA